MHCMQVLHILTSKFKPKQPNVYMSQDPFCLNPKPLNPKPLNHAARIWPIDMVPRRDTRSSQ